MKIIKQGTLPEKPVDESFATICKVCGTNFEFYASECSFHTQNRLLPLATVDCPLCRISIRLGTHTMARVEYYIDCMRLYRQTHPQEYMEPIR